MEASLSKTNPIPCFSNRRVARGGGRWGRSPPKTPAPPPKKKKREKEKRKKKEDVGRKGEKESRTVQRIVKASALRGKTEFKLRIKSRKRYNESSPFSNNLMKRQIFAREVGDPEGLNSDKD